MTRVRMFCSAFAACSLVAQDPSPADLMNLRQTTTPAQQGLQTQPLADTTARTSTPSRQETPETARQRQTDQERLQDAIAKAKARERAPRRFAQDLFETRQASPTSTEGGISDDYVLGVGDQIQINAFGSATFEAPAQVDGRGEVVVPKVGTVKVAGMSLGRARAAVQTKVAQVFSRATVDLSLVKLREVRVFVLGEVYVPGSYLVPSLSSLVNVLSLAGGPTAAGSYRQIRVMRGGAVIHQVDLYPLRADGLGNMNFLLQSGDTVFVPLAFNQVMLEGAFTRVVAATGDLLPSDRWAVPTKAMERLEEEIRLEETRLLALPVPSLREGDDQSGTLQAGGEQNQQRNDRLLPMRDASEQNFAQQEASGQNSAGRNPSNRYQGDRTPDLTTSMDPETKNRTESMDRLLALRAKLKELKKRERGDNRLAVDPERGSRPESLTPDYAGMPGWLSRWMEEGKAPTMQFEFLPGETAKDALRFAGGMALQAFSGNLSLRRLGQGGVLSAVEVPGEGASVPLLRGDILAVPYSRERIESVITVAGWVRVPGTFARTPELRVGDLLKREGEVLPDTYLHRGEIVRTLPDLTTRYFAFDVAKALDGDPAHNLALADRDKVELYRVNDFRLPRTITVLGPVTRPGIFPFHDGMRVSDLLFQAGIPLQKADRFSAEIAHTRGGKASEVKRLDLAKLLTTEQASPVQLTDDAVNPLLEPYDQVSLYAKPGYRAHRVVNVIGQVTRPGFYALDADKVSLRDILARAGGLTPDAMPQATIFLRPLNKVNAGELELEGVETKDPKAKDPTSNGINAILERLSETKRQPTTGNLLNAPLLHGLGSGNLNRLVVNVPAILGGDTKMDVDLQDGDEVIIPQRTEAAYVVGETASPFMTYKLSGALKVRDMLRIAGGTTRNADEANIRLLKADGRILDRSIMGQDVEPGDAVLVPQRIKRDSTWQENLQALTPLALILNAIHR